MEAHVHEATVFEPGSEEVARLLGHPHLSKGNITYLTPIDLKKLAWYAFKSQRHIVWSLLSFAAQLAHVIIEGRVAKRVGMLLICTYQFEHALDWHLFVEPLLNLSLIDGDGAFPLPRLWFLVYSFFEHTSNCITMMSGKISNLNVGPALLL